MFQDDLAELKSEPFVWHGEIYACLQEDPWEVEEQVVQIARSLGINHILNFQIPGKQKYLSDGKVMQIVQRTFCGYISRGDSYDRHDLIKGAILRTRPKLVVCVGAERLTPIQFASVANYSFVEQPERYDLRRQFNAFQLVIVCSPQKLERFTACRFLNKQIYLLCGEDQWRKRKK